MKLIYSTDQDYDAILDVANKIFTLCEDSTYDNNYFQDIQPKIYRSKANMPPHLLAFDDNRLIGMAAIRKNILRLGSEQLTVCGIGTVGVLQEYRGKGVMKAMMNHINHDLKKSDVDLAELGGKRKRYSHFGYTTGGTGADVSISKEEFADFPEVDYHFEEEGQWATDEQVFFCRLHQAQTVYSERKPGLFQETLQTGKRRALKILLHNCCVGYCSVSSSYENIVELAVEEEYSIMSVLRSYVQTFSLHSVLLFNFSPLWLSQNPDILRCASYVSLRAQERYRIFRYQKVLQAGLSAKHALQPLCPGELTVKIQNYGTLRIQIGKSVQVEMTEKIADLSLSEEDAVHLLIGSSALLGNCTKLPAFATGWFPLPIHTLSNDRI